MGQIQPSLKDSVQSTFNFFSEIQLTSGSNMEPRLLEAKVL